MTSENCQIVVTVYFSQGKTVLRNTEPKVFTTDQACKVLTIGEFFSE